MTPQTARRLTIHEHEAAEASLAHRRPLALAGSLVAMPARRPRALGSADYVPPSLLRRESLHRRMLGAADLLAAAASLLFVLTATESGVPGLLILAGTPLVVVL